MLRNKKGNLDWIVLGSHLIFAFLCLSTIIPLILLLVLSLTSPVSIVEKGFSFFPLESTLDAYKFVFKPNNTIFDSYLVTIFITVVGTILGTILTSMLAYVLSRKDYKFRSLVSFYVFFCIVFHAGLIPGYILTTNVYHLKDNIWVLILPSLVNCWYVILLRTFFQDIPEEIVEAAIVDGADEFRIYKDVVLPMAKPAMATIALLLMLGYWNEWRGSMLYMSKSSEQSLQYYLYRLIKDAEVLRSEMSQLGIGDANAIPTDSVKFAAAAVVMGPTLAIFPFFQKYFVRGISSGAVKG